MAQVEISKTVGYAWLAPPADNITVTKVVAYLWLTPGESEETPSNRQGHVYVNITRRLRR